MAGKKYWRPFVALLIAMAIIVAGCGRKDADTAAGTTPRTDMTESPGDEEAGGHLVVGVVSETSGWDTFNNPWAQSGALVGASFIEPLGILDDQGEAKPWLATTWKHNEDFRQWDITVRDDVYFHNGEHLDARVVKANFDEPAKRTRAQGGEPSAAALRREKVEIVDEYTIRVYLRDPYAQYDAASTGWDIVATEMIANPEAHSHPIGTGPFVFEEWKKDNRLTAKKNERYWRKAPNGTQLPYLDSIEFRPIIDEATRAAALRSGDLDVIQSVSAPTAELLDPDNTVIRDFDTERTFIMLNTVEGEKNAPNPFTNVHARRALAHAINRDNLIEILGQDAREVPKSTPQGYSTDSKWAAPKGEEGYPQYDPERARQEVEIYKRETGRSSLTFSMLSASSTDEVAMLQAVEAQLHDAGIEMHIENQEVSVLMAKAFTGQYQATGWRWFGMKNPDSNASLLDSQNIRPIGTLGSNFTRYGSPTIDANLKILRESPSFEARQQASWSIIREANDQALFIWMSDAPWSLIAQPAVRGLNGFREYPVGNFMSKPWWGDVWKKTKLVP